MRLRVFVMLFLLVLWGTTQALATDRGDSLEKSLESGQAELRVLWVASEGWAGHDEQGRLTGVTVEIMRRFADWVRSEHDLDVKLNFVEVDDWSRFYQRIRDGQDGLFGLGNVTITEARREELAFSPAYVTNIAVLISHRDVQDLPEPARLAETFAGQRALGFAGTLHEQRLRRLAEKHWPDMPLDLAESNDEIIAAAAADTHFGYVDAYNYYRARDQDQPLRRHPVLDDPGETFGIIMPLDNDWQDWLTEFFAADGGLLETEWYRALLETHLGSEVADILTN